MSIKSIGYEMNIKQEDDCEVEWISEGAMIFRCRCIDLKKVDAGKYVRDQLMGRSGEISCTQPFGII